MLKLWNIWSVLNIHVPKPRSACCGIVSVEMDVNNLTGIEWYTLKVVHLIYIFLCDLLTDFSWNWSVILISTPKPWLNLEELLQQQKGSFSYLEGFFSDIYTSIWHSASTVI